MISASGLSFQYTSESELRFPDFVVQQGEHALLLGESGSGKTTLLHLLGGLLRGYKGSLRVNNTELSSLSENQLDHFRGKNIGFVFQRNHLISALSVEKNVMLSPYLAGVPIDRERVSSMLESLSLGTKKKSRVTALSQGQAQRVAIARALVNKPSIIFADEPTSALDDRNCAAVIELLMHAASQNNASLIVATHDQRLKEKISRHINVTFR